MRQATPLLLSPLLLSPLRAACLMRLSPQSRSNRCGRSQWPLAISAGGRAQRSVSIPRLTWSTSTTLCTLQFYYTLHFHYTLHSALPLFSALCTHRHPRGYHRRALCACPRSAPRRGRAPPRAQYAARRCYVGGLSISPASAQRAQRLGRAPRACGGRHRSALRLMILAAPTDFRGERRSRAGAYARLDRSTSELQLTLHFSALCEHVPVAHPEIDRRIDSRPSAAR